VAQLVEVVMHALQQRFRVAAALASMRYGTTTVIPARIVAESFSPTGEHDRSFAGAIRAMALALGGNRPESSYTSVERVERDLPDDGSYRVELLSDGSIAVRRLLMCCPRCHGEGQYRVLETRPIGPVDVVCPVSTMTVKLVPCDHVPERKS
jgi:hypothetical protein